MLDAADLFGLCAGDGFADLVGDGVGVGAAVPDLVVFGGEGVGVFAGEGVFGFGAGGDFYSGDGVRVDLSINLSVWQRNESVRRRVDRRCETIPVTLKR